MKRHLLSFSVVMIAFVLFAGCEHTIRPYQTVTPADVHDIVVAQAKKGHVVLLKLWSADSEPCRREFPTLVRISEEYRERGLLVIVLSFDDPDDVTTKIEPYMLEMGADFPVLVKARGDQERFLKDLHQSLTGDLPEMIIYTTSSFPRIIVRGEQTYTRYKEHIERSM